MSEWERMRIQKRTMEALYPPGTRVILLQMGNDPHPMEPGARGTVVGVDDIGSVRMQWDNGRTLSLLPEEDVFRALTEEETEAEREQEELCQTM